MLLLAFILASLVSFASTAPTTTSQTSTSTKVADSSCTNGPFTRQCWGNGFSIATDYDTKWPVTGKTVSYHLEITNTTLAPDGYSRLVMAINGQYPGPTISANWGDTLQITVKNSLKNNGTSMHWHGIRQANSCNMDGTNGITECPLAPGETKTYTFLCTQFGTTWYHSHFSAQYGDGVLGPIVIYGPATANYDVDLGAMPITDWYHPTAFQEAEIAARGGPPAADNGLINGTMVNPTAGGGGVYNTVTMTKGKKYRLRLINTSLDNHFMVSLDGHNLTVVQADFVPIVPYSTPWLFIGIGQRYDVIITATQAISSYWFRADVQLACGANNNNFNIKAIFNYAGAPAGDPTTLGAAYTQRCSDETTIVPYVKKNVPSGDFLTHVQQLNISLNGGGVPGQTGNIVTWTINGTPLDIDWELPTLKYVQESNDSFPVDLNLIKLPEANAHGHDFYLLGTGLGTWDNSFASTLQYTNPPRRDVAMLPAPAAPAGGGPPSSGGWLVIAFLTDNPGAWLMHCHIAWHVGEGLAVQFLERESEISGLMSLSTLNAPCKAWDAYQPTAYYVKDDSGL